MHDGIAIRDARKALDLGLEDFARLVDIDVDQLRAIEGGAEAPAALVDEVALVFGAEPDELLFDGVDARPNTVLLRSFATRGRQAFDDMIAHDLHVELGLLVRSVRRKAWLRAVLGHTRTHPELAAFGPCPIAPEAKVPYGADTFAEEVRAAWGLGDAPIPSMIELVRDRLGVDLRFTTPDTLAAYFLAPPSAVRALVGVDPPRAPSTVRRIEERFGLHPTTAVNVLTNLFHWSKQERLDLLDETGAKAPAHPGHPDAVVTEIDDDPTLRTWIDAAWRAGRLSDETRDRWLGHKSAVAPRPDGDRPRGYWTERLVKEALEELRRWLVEGRIDAALRVVWDAIDDWIDAEDFERCESFLGALDPATLDGNVIVGVLAATSRAGEAITGRAAFRQGGRDALLLRGRDAATVDRLLGNGDPVGQ